jgi:hypothetical protein
MIAEVKYLDETEEALRRVMDSVESKEQRDMVLKKLADHLAYEANVKRMPYRLQQPFYKGAFVIDHYLYRNGQMSRVDGGMRRDVKDSLEGILSKLLVENGAGKD